ncbi:POTE ankyrin domain family member B-like isoform X2 [Rhopilema esculentum]|uniref:POTE ankyrin domain family member B-like isoform X2 n=1 Tax=Rhopilema esculentum TaxID=499914 RepID=UPI0031CF4718
MKAVEVFSHQCVLILTEHGASTDVWDCNESTPLHIATVNKKPLIIAVVSNAHGNINIKDKMGYTPLHVASAFGYLEIGKQLIDCGADVNSRDNHGRTPLMAASCEGTPKMVRLLLENGADPSLKDQFGHTAVYYSVQNQSESMSKILKEAIGQRTFNTQETNVSEEVETLPKSKIAIPDAARVASPVTFYTPELKVTKRDADSARKHESTEKTPVLESLQKVDSIVSSEATPFVPGSEFVVNQESFGSLQKRDIVDQITQPTEGETRNETKTESIGEKEIDKEFPILQCKSENETVAGKVETADFKCDFVDAETQTQEISPNENCKRNDEIVKLRERNKELRETNTRLRKKLSEVLKESAYDREEHKQSVGNEKARLQFLNLKNQGILEDKVKQCMRLEAKLHEAHDMLLFEIQNTKEGAGVDQLSKDIIRGMQKRLKASEAKITRLTKQMKVSREEKNLLATEVEVLRGEVIILNDMVTKARKEQRYFDEIDKDAFSDDHHDPDGRTDLLKERNEELENRITDNEALLENMNKLRKENAMLKEQHISDKHEYQSINFELNDAKDQIMALQYQIETMNLDAACSSRNKHKLSVGSGKYVERAKSDSTVHGFRTFDSTFDFFDSK